MKSRSDYSVPHLPSGEISRRQFVSTAGACLGAAVGPGILPTTSAAQTGAPPTAILVNDAYLQKTFPNDVATLRASLKKFVEQQNAYIVSVGPEISPRAIKSQLVKHARRPRRLVIFGDENGIPRFTVNAGGPVSVDYFYGDLDGDG